MRERILDAAEDHFSRHGFWGVTIREVATDAKVDTALLHYYFDTKRGLFDAVSSAGQRSSTRSASLPSMRMSKKQAARSRSKV